MHLILTIADLQTGGAERVLSELANYWVQQGHQVSLITFARKTDLPFYPLDPAIKLFPLELPALSQPSFIKKVWILIRRFWRLRRIFKSLKPDLIVSFIDLMNIGALLASKGLKIPVIISERTDLHHHHVPFFYRHLRNRVYPWAKKLVVQTAAAARYFPPVYQQKIAIIPNALKEPRYVKHISREPVRTIISVGRLGVEKDHKTLIQAFELLLQKYPDLHLTIYGEGQERTSLENLIQSLKLEWAVSLPGIVQNIPQILADADLFIFPSLYEGFPNALGEAMAMGLPVIASNCAGNQALIREGVNGCLFPVGEVKALTRITEDLIQDHPKRIALAKKAQQVTKDFSPQKIFEMWDELIR